jgi:hypothetical protein
MAVEIDAHARPIQPGRNLLDMSGLAGAVIALNHHSPVVLEAGENGERYLRIEQIIGIDIGHVLVRARIRGHFEIGVDAEDLTHGNRHVRQAGSVAGNFQCHGR